MPLNLLEKTLFEQSLHYPRLFRHIIRPALYRRNGNDPEKVHDNVLDMLKERDVLKILQRNHHLFHFPELEINLNGQKIMPFGTAAGMDKDCEALLAYSYVFGFQESGTIVVHKRLGNKPPRVAVDNNAEDAYNAQGFPSKGLDYSLSNLLKFRALNPHYPIYASICGLPLSEKNAIEIAMQEMEQLLKSLNPHVNGFVWNPFSPNTKALELLRTPQTFREHAELMAQLAPDKLRLGKIGPYDNEQKKTVLSLVEGFLAGGGHGVVVVNTYPVPYDWPYERAGKSGRFLQDYRRRAVRDIHKEFPKAIIFATGGIFDADDAYQTFKDGATALEGYTPYTFYGLGLLQKLEIGVMKRLIKDGYENLEKMQLDVRKGVRLLV